MTSRLALGTAQFGSSYGVANRTGAVSERELSAILETAKAAGLTVLDTAALYGNAESRLGEAGVNGWRIVTKLPPLPADAGDIEQWALNAIHDSLARLRQPSVFGLLLHRANDLRGPRAAELYAALSVAKKQGLVSKIGVSIYSPSELDDLPSTFKFDLVQAPLNVFDRRLVSSGWLDRLAGEGAEVHARSVFLQGLLLMRSADRPAYFARWSPQLAAWTSWFESHHLTAEKACLDFVLSHPSIAQVVIGVDTVSQLRDLIAAANAPAAALAPSTLAVDDAGLIEPFRWKLS